MFAARAPRERCGRGSPSTRHGNVAEPAAPVGDAAGHAHANGRICARVSRSVLCCGLEDMREVFEVL